MPACSSGDGRFFLTPFSGQPVELLEPLELCQAILHKLKRSIFRLNRRELGG